MREIEYAYIARFFENYNDTISSVQSGVYALAKNGALADEILSYLKRELGDNLPDNCEEMIREYSRKAWKEGAAVGKIKSAMANDTRAIDWFAKSGKYDFGKVFADFSPQMRQAVIDALEGKANSGADVVAAAVKRTVGEELNSAAIRDRYRLVISNAVNKARNYSRTLVYEEIGIQELEIVAMLDERTSDICKEMDGRRISVRTAASFVRDVMATDPQSIATKFPWPKTISGGKTADIVAKMECKLPPYHGRCRTMTVVGLPERIIVKSGRQLGEIKSPDESSMRKSADRLSGRVNAATKIDEITKDLKTAKEKYRDLTADELSSKINGLRGARWGSYTNPKGNVIDELDTHWRNNIKRQKQMKEKFGAGFSEKDYIKLSEEVCKSFDRVYVQYYAGRHRVIFFDNSRHAAVVVDADTSLIVTCYIHRDGENIDKDFGGRFHEIR